MKLRLRAGSVRLRLQEDEVRRLADDGRVEESVALGSSDAGSPARFIYALEVSTSVEGLDVRYRAGELVVLVPAAQAREWARSGRITLEAELPGELGSALRLRVERDLPCAHRSAGVGGG